jgi:hypothetical protein
MNQSTLFRASLTLAAMIMVAAGCNQGGKTEVVKKKSAHSHAAEDNSSNSECESNSVAATEETEDHGHEHSLVDDGHDHADGEEHDEEGGLEEGQQDNEAGDNGFPDSTESAEEKDSTSSSQNSTTNCDKIKESEDDHGHDH